MRKNNIDIDICEFLAHTFLFSELTSEEISDLLKAINVEINEYSAGEIIYSPHEFAQNIGFVVFGECAVERERVGSPSIPLNILKTYDSFGVLSVFSKGLEFPTCVKTRKRAGILFIKKDEVLNLIDKSTRIAVNIIEFMAERIAFLNDKIMTFSSDNIEQKLSNHIIGEAKSLSAAVLDFNCKRVAETINSGRASLYRAIDSLERKGIIRLENKKIFILDPEGLERISK